MKTLSMVPLCMLVICIACVSAFAAAPATPTLTGKWNGSFPTREGSQIRVQISITKKGKVTAVAELLTLGATKPQVSKFKGDMDAQGNIWGTVTSKGEFRYIPQSMWLRGSHAEASHFIAVPDEESISYYGSVFGRGR